MLPLGLIHGFGAAASKPTTTEEKTGEVKDAKVTVIIADLSRYKRPIR